MAYAARAVSAQSPARQPVQDITRASIESRRLAPSGSTLIASLPASLSRQHRPKSDVHVSRDQGDMHSSRTWTSTSGDIGLLDEADKVDDRSVFVLEYNRLAKKHGIRQLVLDDFAVTEPSEDAQPRRGWFQRVFRSSTNRPEPALSFDHDRRTQHRRSASDLAHLIHSRRDHPKSLDICHMVRLSGKSSFYLPLEYSPCSLILPTCLRATAQHIAQHAETKGIFRIPGSMKVVGAIFDYYCHIDKAGDEISGTVRSATLPLHIQFSIHDIGSTFKRLLSVLPGGILGSLALFDSFIAINSHLHGEPEYPRTKQSKIRARLIALAIGTIESQYRRELICAVFGLLSMIGRIAELAPREDERGRSLPTGDLMGYSALAIVFGPLLVGDVLQSYSMKLAAHDGGLIVLPPATQDVRRRVRSGHQQTNVLNAQPSVDKINIAIGVAKMLISNWRDVVRQMTSLGTHHRRQASSGSMGRSSLRSSASESVLMRGSQDLTTERAPSTYESNEGHKSDPETPTTTILRRRFRATPKRVPISLAQNPKMKTLSPTMEERSAEEKFQAAEVKESGTTPSRSTHPTSARQAYEKHFSAPAPSVSQGVVPTRTSSKDQKHQRVSSATQTIMSFESDIGDTHDISGSPKLGIAAENPAPSSFNAASQTSFEQSPPHYYLFEDPFLKISSRLDTSDVFEAAAMGDVAPSSDRYERQTANAASPKAGEPHTAQSDSKCELKRYRAKNYQAQVGSPYKKLHRQPDCAREVADTFEEQNRTTNFNGKVDRHGNSHPPSKLRKTKSGPMRTGANRKSQTSTPVQRGSVQVWRNGIKQKSSFAKVLRPSKSDGTSLRGTALMEIFSPAKKRAKQSGTIFSSWRAATCPIRFDEKNDLWQDSPVLDEGKTQSLNRNGQEAQRELSVPACRVDVEYLHRIIQCLRDRLLEERLNTEELRKQLRIEGMVEHKIVKGALEEAQLELSAWRDRARGAEKRLKVFEKFRARLRGIRDAAVFSESTGSRNSEMNETSKVNSHVDYVMPLTRVRFAEADGLDGQDGSRETAHCSCDGGEREDHCNVQETSDQEGHCLTSRIPAGIENQGSGLEDVAGLWMAAKELLDMVSSEE